MKAGIIDSKEKAEKSSIGLYFLAKLTTEDNISKPFRHDNFALPILYLYPIGTSVT